MYWVQLFDQEGNVLETLSREGERLLIPQSRWDVALSELSPNEICVFGPEDMAQLIVELDELSLTLSGADLAHVEAIMALARRCESLPGSRLSFRPAPAKTRNA